jgi:putative aldouronate transport system permease protein
MAIAAIAVVPILAVYPFFQRYFVKSITMGAIKG